MLAQVLLALALASVRYPGGAPAASASRRFVVSNEDRAGARNPHVLFVVERSSGTRRPLLEYGRDVAVAWAPDRDALAVTNRVGSTQSTLALFVLAAGGTFDTVDVGETLYATFPGLRGELVSYLHVHVELVAWRRGGAVECRLRASGGSGPDVSRRYLVTVDGQAKRI